MANSVLFAGERDGARVFRVGRVGFDTGTSDPGSNVYTGTYRSERMAPAGNGGLVNFRRVAIHLLASGSYTFSVKVWVDDERTELGSGSTQTVSISGSPGGLSEVTEEVEIEANGGHIQVEVTVDSDDVSGIFLIEKIEGRGRIIRRGSTRTGESS